MNATDRKEISEIVTKLEALKGESDSLASRLGEIASDEREKYDNMSAGFQQGEKGQAIEEAANHLEEAASECEEGNIGAALESLGNLAL